MKNIGIWGAVLIIAVIVGATFVALDYGEPSPIYLAGSVELASELDEAAAPMDTLFLILYDPDSPMPMPYGAVRYKLSQKPHGRFHEFIVTSETLSVMNADRPLPKRFRLKAKLDADGNAGMDQAGDLVGEATDLAFGAKEVVVTINQKI